MRQLIPLFLVAATCGLAAAQDASQPTAAVRPPRDPAGATVTPTRLPDGTYIGEIRLFAFEQGPPKGWKECDGKGLKISEYQRLFEVIGDRFGSEQAGFFNLPDLRGTFARGWNHGKTGGTHDPDAKKRQIPPGGPAYPDGTDHVGSFQLGALQEHKHNDSGHVHTLATAYRNDFGCGTQCGAYTIPSGALLTSNSGTANLGGAVDFHGQASIQTSSETRSVNVYVMYCVRDGTPSS